MAYIGYPYSTEQALNIKFEGDFVRVPTGSTDDRTNNIPAPEAGMFRFNTTESKFEGYTGNDWGSIGGSNTVDFTDVGGTTHSISFAGLPFYLADSTFSPILMQNGKIKFKEAGGSTINYKVR